MKILNLVFTLFFAGCIYGQEISFHVTGSIELQAENYDFPIIFTHNEMADLQLIIYKNGVEYSKAGPHRNSNEQSFGLTKIQLNATDTIRIDCYDVDDNNIFTLGLNSDDFICSFNFTADKLISSGTYTDSIFDTRNILRIRAIPYYNANISILSYKPRKSIGKSEIKMIKKGLYWQPKYEVNFTSSLQKVKKGMITWNDSYIASVYDNMLVELTTKTFYNDLWIDLNVSIKPGIQQVSTFYGEFEVEVTPIK